MGDNKPGRGSQPLDYHRSGISRLRSNALPAHGITMPEYFLPLDRRYCMVEKSRCKPAAGGATDQFLYHVLLDRVYLLDRSLVVMFHFSYMITDLR